ncbi:DUF4157 domain-containing protein [Diaphorobacter limosus]|uniref:DUF4157 domain-containing protein n=1 Tax=Diaphorobacter limosus TaxID=3036128 RepID=A0ABZ0J2T4_9BURK|nr:DUF4157 domain-containing protein [Diaphorobacter sp. Y-1]WOO32545.1 DUF4157 domain-containing protein [Diaphorobacter sp. Y-1]
MIAAYAAAKPVLQRKCACGGKPRCPACEARKRLGTDLGLQPRSAPAQDGAATAEAAQSLVQGTLRGPGQPLDRATRLAMEPLFGHDFGRVRVHADAQAQASAQAVGALAYTVGQHIVFGPGQRPAAGPLLAHELAHTVQQQGTTGSLQRLAIDGADSAMEHEAEAAAQRVAAGRPAQVRLRAGSSRLHRVPVSNEAAGGCGICYDTAYPGQGPANAGRVAHTVVQAAFLGLGTGMAAARLDEMPFSAPGDENGRLDLVQATPTGLAIGEIKPSTPAGLAQGVKDLAYYMEQVQAVYPDRTITPLVAAIRVGNGLTMPDPLAQAAGCAQQKLGVHLMEPGIFGYFCTPPYSQARSRCPCRKQPPPPVPVPVEKDVKVKERKPARKDSQERAPGGSLVPAFAAALAATATLATLASKLKGLAKSRLLAAASAVAIVALLAKGAEASIGPGEDPIETLIKSGDATGQPIPDDIKEALRKDDRLRKLLTEAARTGNYDAARREAAEQLTRVVAQNLDAFSDEELQALLQATDGVKGQMPQGEVTVEQIRQRIAARQRGGGAGSGAGPAAPAGDSGSGSGSGSAATHEEPAAPETAPDAAPPARPQPAQAPAERLVEGMARPAAGGPRFTESARNKLLEAARAMQPPLTDAEVDELLRRMGPATGKTEDQVVESLRQGMAALRAGKAAQDSPAADPAPASPDATPPPAADQDSLGDPQVVPADPAKPPTRTDKDVIPIYDEVLAKLEWIQPGNSYLLMNKPPYLSRHSYPMTHFGRDSQGRLFVGSVMVRIDKQAGNQWTVTLQAGAPLYTTGRRYGTTRTRSATVTAPAAALGTGPAKPAKGAKP